MEKPTTTSGCTAHARPLTIGLLGGIGIVTVLPVTCMSIPGYQRCSIGRGAAVFLLRSPLVALVVLVVLVCIAGRAAVSCAADWPQFLGPNRNGSSPGEPLAPTPWPKEGPPVLWQRSVGAGFSGPVVSGGRVILFHRVEDEEVVECLDARSGQPRWKSAYPTRYRDDFGFDEGPRATPAVANGHVFTFGAEGMLHAWDLETGRKRWSVDSRATFHADKGFFGVACSPLAEGGAVVLNIGGRGGAGIVAFDQGTGRVLWKATDDEASYASPVAATFAGQRRLVVITRSAIVALNPADGKVVFRHPWRPPMHASVSAASPLVLDDQIFVSASYGTGATLFRYQEKGLDPIWSAEDALSNHYATSVAHRGYLYGFDGRQEQGCELRCVDMKTGKVRWSERGLKAGTVTLAGEELLVLTERGELLRAPAEPGGFKVSDRAQILPLVVRAHPAVAGGRFFARSKDKLICVDLGPAKVTKALSP